MELTVVSKAGVDVAVVGGGAAGLSAAIAAASAGVRTVLFDERRDERGTLPDSIAPIQQDGVREELVARANAAGVDVRHETLVWGLFAGGLLGVAGSSGSEEIVAKRIVLATGSTGAADTPEGRHPDIKLALMAECAVGFSAALGGWVPGRDRDLVSSEKGILVAGDGAGLCTFEVALAEGHLAGVTAAFGLGFGLDGAVAEAEARSGLERIAPDRIAEVEALHAWYIQGRESGLTDAGLNFAERAGDVPESGAEVIMCACEGVSERAIDAAIAEGARSLNDVKRRTRAGMGICQGIECLRSIAAMVSQRTGVPVGQIVPMTARPPVRPIRLGDLARGDE